MHKGCLVNSNEKGIFPRKNILHNYVKEFFPVVVFYQTDDIFVAQFNITQ